MPGYIRGFVEREFAGGWEFVCRVDPFTRSKGAFRDVFLAKNWASALEPVVHERGVPEDLAQDTKLAMLGRSANPMDRLSNEDLHEQFQTFRERLSKFTPPRHVTLAKLIEFDWECGITHENRRELAEEGPTDLLNRVLRLFELVDADGEEYAEWGPERDEDWRIQFAPWSDTEAFADQEETEALLRGEWVEYGDRHVSLRPRSRRELVPDDWFDLLRLLHRDDHRDVRFIFYWHH